MLVGAAPSSSGAVQAEALPGGSVATNLPADAGHGFNPWVRKIPGEEPVPHFSIPARKVSWTEEPAGLQSTGSQGWTRD